MNPRLTDKETDPAVILEETLSSPIFSLPVWGSVHCNSLSEGKSNWENLKRRLGKKKTKGERKMRPFSISLLKTEIGLIL